MSNFTSVSQDGSAHPNVQARVKTLVRIRLLHLPDAAGLIFGNAASWFFASVVTSALGAGFWWVATHHFTRYAVGVASASISAVALIGSLSTLGLNTLLMGEVRVVTGRSRGAVAAAALVVAGLMGLCLGAGYTSVAGRLSQDLAPLSHDFKSGAVFAIGCGLTACSMVLDQYLLGSLRGRMQLARNSAFAVIKLGLLSAIVLRVGPTDALSIISVWMLSILLSVLVLLFRRDVVKRAFRLRADFGALRKLRWAALGHHALNLALKAPLLTLPVIVLTILSAQANAVFYISWTIAGLVWMIPGTLSGMLYAIGGGSRTLLAQRLRFTLVTSGGLVSCATAIVLIGAPLILAIFGRAYASGEAVATLRLLMLGSFAIVVKYHYFTLVRIQREMLASLPFVWAATGLEIAAAVVGANLAGLPGLAEAWLAAVYVEAILMAPRLWRAVLPPPWIRVAGGGQHKKPAPRRSTQVDVRPTEAHPNTRNRSS